MGFAVAGAASLGSGILGAFGAFQQGQAQAQAAKYNSIVAQHNANQATLNAAMTMEAGNAQVAAEGRKNRATMGEIKAQQAASGINVNTGSTADVQQSAHELGELDALTVRSNAAKEAYGYQVQSKNFEAESQLKKIEASHDLEASYINSGTTFLGSASDASTNYARYTMAGGLG